MVKKYNQIPYLRISMQLIFHKLIKQYAAKLIGSGNNPNTSIYFHFSRQL